MPSLSICMIVKNEEDYLENSLNSVKDIADEIIIIDTGSTDKTIEIAKRFTDKVYNIKWTNDFSKARNISLSKATKEWILVLDADEKISKKDNEKILELIKSKNADGFSMIQRNYTNDSTARGWKTAKDDEYDESKNYGGWFEARITRLFKKGFEFSGEVHESIIKSIEEKKGNLVDIKIPIHHFNAEKKSEEKNQKYLELGIKKAEKRKDAKSYYELGIQQLEMNNLKSAEQSFLNTLKINPGIVEAYQNLGVVYIKEEQPDKAMKVLFKAINLNKKNPIAFNNLGIVLIHKKRIKEAELLFKKAIELDPKYASAYKNLGMCQKQQGKEEESKHALEKAFELNPRLKK